MVFLSLEPRDMTRDMSGRLAPICNALTVKSGVLGQRAWRCSRFAKDSVYLSKVLAVA